MTTIGSQVNRQQLIVPAEQPAPSLVVPHVAPRLLQQFRRRLHTSGYVAAQEILTSGPPQGLSNPPYELHLLRRLFARGDALSMQEAAQALGSLDLADLIDAGLMRRSGDTVKALFQVQVYRGLLFIVDFMPHEHPADLVLPIGPSGMYLASLTVRQKMRSALDLGCGCGIQALLIASHSRRVTATDINPRALALTRLNAGLNGIRNVETVHGSFFEPLQGRKFDLIVANLPYVITPDDKFVYRDLGSANDSPIRQNVEAMAAHLNEGGYAVVMLNWIHAADQAWWQPVESWISKRGVDAWLIYSRSMTPEQYSTQWMTVSESEAPQEYAQTKQRWLQWYAAQGIERIGFGALALRRRAADDNWRCSIMVEHSNGESLGWHLQHLFHSQDALNRIKGPAKLLDELLAPWNANLEPVAGQMFEMRTRSGFLLRQKLHPSTAMVVSRLSGKTPLRQAMQQAGIDLRDSAAATQVLGEIYQLMNLGLIGVMK